MRGENLVPDDPLRAFAAALAVTVDLPWNPLITLPVINGVVVVRSHDVPPRVKRAVVLVGTVALVLIGLALVQGVIDHVGLGSRGWCRADSSPRRRMCSAEPCLGGALTFRALRSSAGCGTQETRT
jgi:hypothetical protein